METKRVLARMSLRVVLVALGRVSSTHRTLKLGLSLALAESDNHNIVLLADNLDEINVLDVKNVLDA